MRVLLVEADSKLAALVGQGLEEHGVGVDVSGDATAGLRLALSNDYDAILLAVRLPGKSGFTMLRELRRSGSAVPVMIVSGRSSVQDRVRGLDLGADDYLCKPFDLQELLARLRAIKRRPASPPRMVLTAADLKLDTVRHEVTRRGRHIELTSKEFALLEYLLRSKGSVVTQAMILNHVWDLDYQAKSNLVEVYISCLRRKIDQTFKPKLIHTVYGTGYVLREGD